MKAQKTYPIDSNNTATCVHTESYKYLRSIRRQEYSAQFVGVPTTGPYKDARVYCDAYGCMFLVINGTKAYIDLPDYSFRKAA